MQRYADRVAQVGLASALPLALTAVVLGGCTAGDATAPAPAPPPPPPPPAACLLDTGALARATGLTWAPDPATAGDTRCVYDPAGSPRPDDGPAFLSVDVTPDPAPALDTVAELCEDGSRAPVGTDGFVCRFQGGNVFAAVTRDGGLVTLAASAVPAGTTAAQLVVAFDQQVAALAAG
ncbi:hypothetical protein [Pseudonocardia zijingensis]|uniref:DUF3558 domain-containing protein n=1 Tax=Pseudonocardia zijingensis TaxID=153376 RepID=A0ABN1PY64_9PSEU